MKSWIIAKDKLLEAAEVICQVPSRPGLPSSEFFRVDKTKDGVQFTLASEVTGIIKMEGEGAWPFEKEFYLDRRVFIPFVLGSKTVASKAPFKFLRHKDTLVVKNGKRKARFVGQAPVPGYGFTPSGKLESRLGLNTHAQGLIYCARECSTSDPTMPMLNCVYLVPNGKEIKIYATNQKITFKGHSKVKIKSDKPIPFPLYLVQLLGSEHLKEIRWHKTFVTLTFSHGFIWQSVPDKAKRFPAKEIDKHIRHGEGAQLLFQISSKKFSDVIASMCSYLTAVRRQDWLLSVSGEKGSKEIILTSIIPQTTFQERLTVDKEIKHSFKMDWPLDMLEPVFTYLNKKDRSVIKVRQSDNGLSYVMTDDLAIAVPKREA